MKRYTCLLVALAIILAPAAAQSVRRFSPSSARMVALGGPHAASVSGLDAIFENPAAFATAEAEFSASALVFNPSGPIFDIAGLALGGPGRIISGISSLFDDKGRFFAQADLLGPLSFGYMGKGLGFGLFNRSVATVNASSLLSLALDVSEQLLLAGGYAYRIALGTRNVLDLGIMPKGFITANVGERMSLTKLMSLVDNPSALLDLPMTMVSGVGFDVGLRWSLDNVLAVGLVARDAYSPAMVTRYQGLGAFLASPMQAKLGESAYAVVPPDLAVGLAFEPRHAILDSLGAHIVFLVDYVDLLDLLKPLPRNPILNLGLGLELTLLDILSLRAGVKDALPTAGLGVDLAAFEFSLAMFGRELGSEPGSRPLFNLLVALDFSY